MTKEKIKQVMDACYQAKRVRDMMPKLPNGVTPTHIHYLDVITRFERPETDVKVSDISDELGLPRPGVTKTIKDMERLGFVEKKASEADGRLCISGALRLAEIWLANMLMSISQDWGSLLPISQMKMQIL